MRALEILDCGPWVTVQDSGRRGWQHTGVTTGGPLLPTAFRLAQRAVDNPPEAAGLEIPWGMCQLRLTTAGRIAVTGAPLPLYIDDVSQPMDRSFTLPAGAVLRLGRPTRGVWSYLAVAGGIATEPVLGSRATVVREGLGGLEGRMLRAGDILPLGASNPGPCRRLPQAPERLRAGSRTPLRFLPGFQFNRLPTAARDTLLASQFTVSARSDRMGVRLEGPAVTTAMTQLWSEGTCLGAIQIPPDGQPIVLLNDRQTMGGYPMAGAVIAGDCERLAQLHTGEQVSFEPITVIEADRVQWLRTNYAREQILPALPMDPVVAQ